MENIEYQQLPVSLLLSGKDELFITVYEDMFQHNEMPIQMFLAGDVVLTKRTDKITSGNIYYLMMKESLKPLFFCTITEKSNLYIIDAEDGDIVEVLKEDLFKILDVYEYVKFMRKP